MSDEKEIPMYRCTSCLQPLPKDKEQNVIAMSFLRPQSDDTHNFIEEAQNLIHYANAAAVMCIEAEKKSADVVYSLHQLVDELTEEANRRLERAQEALEIIWEREEKAKKASPTQTEGRA